MKKMRSCQLPLVAAVVLVLMVVVSEAAEAGCPPSRTGTGCKGCIVKQMKSVCPSCMGMIRCMARCLWGGTAKSKCTRACDHRAQPRISDCKRCMSPCRCTCVASA